MNEEGESLVKEFNLSSINEVATFGGQHTIETDSIYSLLDTATYTEGANGEMIYSLKYYFSDMLSGYSSNQIISASKTTTVSQINGQAAADGAAIQAGQTVMISGEVELTRSELTAPNFNLIYEDGKYYTSKMIDDPNNPGNLIPDPNDKKGVELPTTGANQDGTFNDDQLKQWSQALSSFGSSATVTGIKIDPTTGAVTMSYNLEFEALQNGTYDADGKYFVGDEIEDPLEAYGLANSSDTTYVINFVSPSGQAQITKQFTYNGNLLVYNTENGKFSYIGTPDSDSATLTFSANATSRDGTNIPLTHFTNIDIDFSISSNVNNGGTSTAGMLSGDVENPSLGTGRKNGELTGVEIGQDGKITAYYDNNQSKLLGQIAVANFANASGLSKQGDNLYSATANSGEFDGIGDDITANGNYMTSGVLEMSNVDLSQEFTEMITTQRGFQANSRIITVSDTMLEELVNLKR